VVAAVAAYASYEHQRTFAVGGGADPVGASLWPLSVDGLLVLSTIGLLKPADQSSRRSRYAVRLAFFLGIAVSLAANVAAAPRLAWQPVLVAGWPPVALLLAVELLAHGPLNREMSESPAADVPVGRSRLQPRKQRPGRDRSVREMREGAAVNETEANPSRLVEGPRSRDKRNAEQIMWDYFQRERAEGRTPAGAELDRVAGTNNYGRAVLARWRKTGRIRVARERVDAVEVADLP
jgi:hypothetical protein